MKNELEEYKYFIPKHIDEAINKANEDAIKSGIGMIQVNSIDDVVRIDSKRIYNTPQQQMRIQCKCQAQRMLHEIDRHRGNNTPECEIVNRLTEALIQQEVQKESLIRSYEEEIELLQRNNNGMV